MFAELAALDELRHKAFLTPQKLRAYRAQEQVVYQFGPEQKTAAELAGGARS